MSCNIWSILAIQFDGQRQKKDLQFMRLSLNVFDSDYLLFSFVFFFSQSINSISEQRKLASESKNRCNEISVWWINVQQAIERWIKCIWANYSCFFFFSPVFPPIVAESYKVHTHILFNSIFSSFSYSLLLFFYFVYFTLFCFSVCVFFFSFSFTVHLHRTDHLSWVDMSEFVFVCVWSA